MGVVYAITSGKGGVGKTTTVANISTGLAMKGYSVAAVDGDIGLRNLDLVMGLENRIVYDLVDVIEGRATLKQALIKDKKLKGKLQLLPASQTKDKNTVTPEQMTKLSEELKKDFDFAKQSTTQPIEKWMTRPKEPMFFEVYYNNDHQNGFSSMQYYFKKRHNFSY